MQPVFDCSCTSTKGARERGAQGNGALRGSMCSGGVEHACKMRCRRAAHMGSTVLRSSMGWVGVEVCLHGVVLGRGRG